MQSNLRGPSLPVSSLRCVVIPLTRRVETHPFEEHDQRLARAREILAATGKRKEATT